MDGVTLLAEARVAGLEVRVDGERLIVRGPKSAEPLALALLELKAEVLPLLTPRPVELTHWLSQRPPGLHLRVLAAKVANDLPALRAALSAQSEALEAFLEQGEHALEAAGREHPDYPRALQRWTQALRTYESLERLRAALLGQCYDRKALAEWVATALWRQGDMAGVYEVATAYLDAVDD